MSEPTTTNRYVTHEEFSEFRADIKGEFKSLRGFIDRISTKQADAGKPNWGVLVGLTSVVWAIVAGGLAWGMSQSIKAENTSVQTQTYQQQFGRWVESTQGWITDNETRDDEQDVQLGQLASDDKATLLRLVAMDDRAKRLEDWYNGHGQSMVSDIARVEGQTAAFQASLTEHIDDLDDIRTQLHAHIGDGHPRRVESKVAAVDERVDRLQAQYDSLLALLMEVRESRNTHSDGVRRDEQLRELYERTAPRKQP